MKFIEQLKAVFTSLKMVDKARNQEMTSADWKAIRVAYRKEYGTELAADQAEFQRQQEAQAAVASNPSQDAADNAAALAILNAALAEAGGGNDNESAPAGGAATPVQRTDSVVDAAQAIAGALREMSRQPLPDNPTTVNGSTLSPNGPGHTEAYFCGIEHPLFSMERRYNRIALNPALALTQPLNAVMEKEVGAEFRAQLSAYAGIVAGRINELRQANLLNPALLAEGVSIGIDPKGLGDQFFSELVGALLGISLTPCLTPWHIKSLRV